MDQILSNISTNIATGGLPLIIAGATIIALINARNQHLSDRSREVTKARKSLERELKDVQGEELISLKKEIKDLDSQDIIFQKRYRRTAYSLVSSIISFVCFVIVNISAEVPGRQGVSYPQFAELFTLVGAITLLYSLVVLIIEFWEGKETLKINSGHG